MSGGGSKKSTVGHKYYADMHLVLALSNFDHISHIWFADKLAWSGRAEGLADGYSQITINKPSLFGGEKKEGGVGGTIDVGMGWPDQPRNNYLVSRLGSDLMSAYRGVVSLIFRNFYFGNNYYLKSMKCRAQAIHKLSDGSAQWYDEKAEILDTSQDEGLFFVERFDDGIDDYDSQVDYPGNLDNFSVEGGALRIEAPYPSSGYIFKDVEFVYVTSLSVRFKVDVRGVDDVGRLYLFGSGGLVVAVNPSRQSATDSLQRCHVWSAYLSEPAILSPSALELDVWFRLEVRFNRAAKTVSMELYKENGETLVGSAADLPLTSNVNINQVQFRTEGVATGHANGVVLFDDVEIYGYRDSGDINPIHFIRECHTDKIWGGRFPDAKIGPSYEAAADTIFDEGLGTSFLFTKEIRWREIIAEIQRHIDAVTYQDPDTGLMEIKLIRDDYDVGSLPVLGPHNSDLEQISRPLDHEVVNQVVVEFWNRATRQNDSVTLSDAAAVDMVGYISQQTFQYSGIATKRVAMMVAERDLARVSKPFHKGRVKTNRTVANLKPGDAFVLSSPDDNIDQMVCRVIKRQESGLLNGEITLEFGEDIFGQVFTTFAEPGESNWIDPIGDPKAFAHETAFEVPYYLIVQDQGETATGNLPEEACYYGFAGVDPGEGGHIDYDLYVYPDGTTQEPDPEFALTASFTPVAVVSGTVDETALTIPTEALEGADSVRVGQLIMAGNTTDAEREWLVLDAEVADGDTQITVRRGLIDTLPREIPSGTVLYFVETFYGGSEVEYMPGETVEGYGAPSNGQGSYDGPFTYHDVPMVGRFNKPYPPGNFRIDGQSYPDQWYVPPANQVVFDWAHRDRVQQSDQTIDHFDSADYGPESLTTYLVEADAYDTDGALLQANWLSTDVGLVKTYTLDLDTDVPPVGTATIVVRVWTVRDGETSLQPATSTFLVPGTEIIADQYDNEPILDINGNYTTAES